LYFHSTFYFLSPLSLHLLVSQRTAEAYASCWVAYSDSWATGGCSTAQMEGEQNV